MAQFGDREHYIPIRKSDLVELLASDSMLHEDERQAFREFCELLAAYYHFLYHDEHEKLKDAYDPFDPDSETHRMQQLSDTARYTELGRCFDHLEHLLERANFTKLSKMDLYDVIEQQSHWGLALDVDFEVFERLELFVRGEKTTQRGRRRWQNLFREEMVDLNVYERVVMVLHLHEHERLRGERVDYNAVYIKLFKNIPKLDLDMLLPGTRVRMTVVDQGKIILPTITGVFTTLGKLVTGGIAIATASITGILAMLGLIGGTIGYGIKSFFGYLQTKQKYQFSLTQSLYYQNLDNNAGVISRILDSVPRGTESRVV